MFFKQVENQRVCWSAMVGIVASLALQGCGPKGVRDPDVLGDLGCKSGLSVCVQVIMPPEIVEAGGLRNFAVVPGSGQGAASLATQLEARLSKVTVDDKAFYSTLKAKDPARQAVFEISSTAWNVVDARETQERSRCIDKSCKNMQTYKVSCTVRKATVGGLIRLKNRFDVIATRDASGVAESTQCQGESGTLSDPSLLLGQASSTVLDVFQNALAVRTAQKRLRLLEADGDISNVEHRKRFAEAVEFSKAGRMDRACPIYDELIEVATGSVAVFYNAGFCAQARGDWRQAYQLYSKADSNSVKPWPELKLALDETRAYGALSKSQARGGFTEVQPAQTDLKTSAPESSTGTARNQKKSR